MAIHYAKQLTFNFLIMKKTIRITAIFAFFMMFQLFNINELKAEHHKVLFKKNSVACKQNLSVQKAKHGGRIIVRNIIRK